MNKKWKWKKWIGNEIRSKGAQSLSEALKINTSLTSLNLRGDENEKKWKMREKKKWKWMKWIGNQIGPEGAKTLSEVLKINTSLTSLNLGGDENEMKER